MKLFVFDTNVLISAHLLRHSDSRSAYDIALENGLILHTDETLDEFAQTFIRPKFDKYLSIEKRLIAIQEFESNSFLVKPSVSIKISRDTGDDKFISLACSANVDFIISGDKDLLTLHPFRGIPIVSPAMFLRYYF